MARINLYVDGESHFIRTEQCFKRLYQLPIERAIHSKVFRGTGHEWPTRESEPILLCDRRCKFFWDRRVLAFTDCFRPFKLGQFFPGDLNHAVYFGSVSGDEDLLQSLRVLVRGYAFEPVLVKERSDLAKRREQELLEYHLVEKPKGIDIAMAARILEDAYRNLFDICVLFTSDVDYLPVIRSVQQLGKKVSIVGYREGIGKRSDLEHVPDAFLDLEPYVKAEYEIAPEPASPANS